MGDELSVQRLTVITLSYQELLLCSSESFFKQCKLPSLLLQCNSLFDRCTDAKMDTHHS